MTKRKWKNSNRKPTVKQRKTKFPLHTHICNDDDDNRFYLFIFNHMMSIANMRYNNELYSYKYKKIRYWNLIHMSREWQYEWINDDWFISEKKKQDHDGLLWCSATGFQFLCYFVAG